MLFVNEKLRAQLPVYKHTYFTSRACEDADDCNVFRF